MVALTIHDGKPLAEMWAVAAADWDILPPPGMGRHGMTKNRFYHLRAK